MGFLGDVWDKVTDVAHEVSGVPTADEKRNAKRMVTDQIKAYKEQTELLRAETDRKRGEEASEKRRVEEKQIRSLRRNYRGVNTGMLGANPAATPDMTTKLGG